MDAFAIPVLPEPRDEASAGTKERFLDYLDFYRSAIAVKLDGLSDADLHSSNLPSGWSPLELLLHLVFMERRWLRWRFLGEDIDDPQGDDGSDGRWTLRGDDTLAGLLSALAAGGQRTRTIVEAADLTDLAAGGAEALGGSPPPTLEWILFHVLQEYARHAGHLDVVRELIDGRVGEDEVPEEV
ncbi:MAG TPA: DUF664 domain-containing protein [Nocardioidaceae bacterium]|nr:DUF664 domain-containing protein [Nocardioidaceae bacterium]